MVGTAPAVCPGAPGYYAPHCQWHHFNPATSMLLVMHRLGLDLRPFSDDIPPLSDDDAEDAGLSAHEEMWLCVFDDYACLDHGWTPDNGTYATYSDYYVAYHNRGILAYLATTPLDELVLRFCAPPLMRAPEGWRSSL